MPTRPSRIWAIPRTHRAVLATIWLVVVAIMVAKPIVAPPVVAQTPVPTPDETTAQPGLLLVQLAARGTFALSDGDAAVAILTLEEVWPRTIYFSDRPERIAGTIETAALLEMEGVFDPEDPPNAAMVLSDPVSADADVIIVELRDPTYDPVAGTLRYAVRLIAEEPTNLAPWITRRDPSLPSSFANVSIFIARSSNTVITSVVVGMPPSG